MIPISSLFLCTSYYYVTILYHKTILPIMQRVVPRRLEVEVITGRGEHLAGFPPTSKTSKLFQYLSFPLFLPFLPLPISKSEAIIYHINFLLLLTSCTFTSPDNMVELEVKMIVILQTKIYITMHL